MAIPDQLHLFRSPACGARPGALGLAPTLAPTLAPPGLAPSGAAARNLSPKALSPTDPTGPNSVQPAALDQGGAANAARALRSGSRFAGVRVDAGFVGALRYVLVAEPHLALLPAPRDTRSADNTRSAAAFNPDPSLSWIEHVPGWLAPDSLLFDALLQDCDWQSQRREMYDRVVDVPRLLATPAHGSRSATLLHAFSRVLSLRYGRKLESIHLALYRDGNDSVAPHGDKLGVLIPDTVVAILSLGFRRTLRLRPQAAVGLQTRRRSLRFDLGQGDLFVMGGRCQADWLHGVPKVRRAGPRMSVMFREQR